MSKRRTVTVRSAITLGVGSMVGAGIFALLGEAAASAGSAVNGGLYGTTNITYALAEKGQLPARFGREIRATTRGLTISAAAALILLSVLACLFAIGVWLIYTVKYAPASLGIFVSFILIALAAESLLQRLHRRKIVTQQR